MPLSHRIVVTVASSGANDPGLSCKAAEVGRCVHIVPFTVLLTWTTSDHRDEVSLTGLAAKDQPSNCAFCRVIHAEPHMSHRRQRRRAELNSFQLRPQSRATYWKFPHLLHRRLRRIAAQSSPRQSLESHACRIAPPPHYREHHAHGQFEIWPSLCRSFYSTVADFINPTASLATPALAKATANVAPHAASRYRAEEDALCSARLAKGA